MDRVRARLLDPVWLSDLVQSGKTALAGVLAWILATEVFALEQPFLAPWSAVLVVHATVYRTFARGAQQVAATVLGVLLAWLSGVLFGPGPLGMAITLTAAFLIGRGRWLRQEATTIATTGIVVLATNAITQSNLLWGRLLDTSVGIAVGLAINLAVWPPLRHRAAWARAADIPGRLADVLRAIAEGMSPDLEAEQVEGWITSCRDVDRHIDEAWGWLREAQESARFNPRRPPERELAILRSHLHWLEQAVADVQSLARTVAISADRANTWGDTFRSRWSGLVTQTADALDSGDPHRLAAVDSELGRLATDLSDDALSHASWQEYGGLLVNLRNVVIAVSHTEAGLPLTRRP